MSYCKTAFYKLSVVANYGQPLVLFMFEKLMRAGGICDPHIHFSKFAVHKRYAVRLGKERKLVIERCCTDCKFSEITQ